MRLFHLERLLCLGNALALARDPSLQQLEGLLHLRRLGLFLGQRGPRSLQVLARLLEIRLPGFCRFPPLGVVLPPGVALRPQLGKLRFEALARVGHEANFRFQPRYVRVGPIELALRGAEAIARRVMVTAGLIELALDLPQPRRLRLELRRPALDVARVSLRFGIGFVAAQKPQQVLFERPLGRKLVIPARARFSRVSARRCAVSRRRSLYLDTPAASSRNTRSSSGFASMIREIMPCSMMA